MLKIIDYRDKTLINNSSELKTRKKINRIVIHCIDAVWNNPERLSRFFVTERKFNTCGYHYYITKESVYYMVDENIITSHAKGYNLDSLGIAIDYSPTLDKKYGDVFNLFHSSNNLMIKNLILLLAELKIRLNLNISKIVGHRELFGTGWLYGSGGKILLIKECPGNKLNLDILRIKVLNVERLILNEGLPGYNKAENIDNWLAL